MVQVSYGPARAHPSRRSLRAFLTRRPHARRDGCRDTHRRKAATMANGIEVRVGGRGVVRGDEAREDGATPSACALCGADAETVASITPRSGTELFACANCLRERLDAISVGR